MPAPSEVTHAQTNLEHDDVGRLGGREPLHGGALKADEDAADFEPLTQSWLGQVDEVRALDRKLRQDLAIVDAARAVANGRLDPACVAFGDELYAAVGKDRASPRWTQFFPLAVSRFVRQALPRQVATVSGWLQSSQDPVLAKHRPTLEKWSRAASDAIVKTRAMAVARGELRQKREELADNLTRERDGLHEALAGRARERALPRGWPDLFFRVQARRDSAQAEETPATSAPTPPTTA